MKIVKSYSTIIFLMLNSLLFGQIDKSELITFDNNQFISLIQSIIKENTNCISNSKIHNWYIEEREDGSIIVSINRIANLLQSNPEKYIYTTIINKKIVFYITQNENINISKTHFFVDLCSYQNVEYVLFEDFSSWLIMKDQNNNFVIKNKRLFKCP
ncbi:hypothetical protein [Aureivirga sp. CE67]|uniref:hypothetical protein n=1 Tax=Aureivirga sp. CE67 TaxID=1788983 RepID=UPI0018CAA8E0|nr:hypothetical protein [Aureivirga sp. CE67]